MLHRRAVALWTLGRYRPALDDLRRAVAILQRAGDPAWTARALTARGLVYVALGSPGRADDDFVTAGRLYAGTGQQLESVHIVLNRALAAFSLGDLPAALSYLDTAADRYRPLNVPTSALRLDRCAVLLAAGLASDALAEADAGLADLEQIRGRSTWKSELLLMAASCALAAAQPQTALDRAEAAHRLFRSQQSAWWQAHTGLVLGRARYLACPVSGALLRAAGNGAATGGARLGRGHPGSPAGRAGGAGPGPPGGRRAPSQRGRAEPAARPGAGPGQRLARRSAARRGGGRSTPNAGRLPPRAGGPGRVPAHAGRVRAARPGHRARHRAGRAGPASCRPVRPAAAAAQLERALAGHRAGRARGTAPGRGGAGRQPGRAARDQHPAGEHPAPGQAGHHAAAGTAAAGACGPGRSLRARGQPGARRSELRIGDLLDQLGAAQLIEIVDVDGAVHVLVCGGGQVRQFTAGRACQAARAADLARFALRRLARSRPGSDLESALAILSSACLQLQDALLGPADGQLGDGPVVIVPPGKLHSVPWALLPALADRAFSVAPSATAWMRADAAAPPPHRRVTLARGPGLATDGAEVPLVAPLYQRATLLAGADATAGRVLRAVDGAWLAHIAAHGSFRADSPLFSALHLYDGPLTVYDFETLRRAVPAGAAQLRRWRPGPGRRQRAARPGQQSAAAGYGRHHRQRRAAERRGSRAAHG